jgi:hypothetical protein
LSEQGFGEIFGIDGILALTVILVIEMIRLIFSQLNFYKIENINRQFLFCLQKNFIFKSYKSHKSKKS